MTQAANSNSWIYVYSQFTKELMTFQILAICVLCAIYAGFWIIKKRRLGVAGELIPSGFVKNYLNVLIQDANMVRTQLFGLLGEAGVGDLSKIQINLTAPAGGAAVSDPSLAARLAELEGKLNTQNQAMSALEAQKKQIEAELAAARANVGSGGGGGGGGDTSGLQKKIKELEAKLAEYSVIEDDLANLKRLQQENAQLKEQLAGKGGAAPAAPTATAPAATATGATAAAVAAASDAAAPVETINLTPPAELAPTPAPEKTDSVAEIAKEPAAPAAFEGLVDQVEQSLKEPTAVAPTPEPAPEAAAAPAADPAAAVVANPEAKPGEAGALENVGKSDEDLLSEFEKMLNM
ncbi:MAG: hypothetical protein AB7P04_01035 [Bacteriovoracia bacterium]